MPTTQTINPYVPFIQQLLKAADLEMLPEEERDDYIEDITREIERRVGLLLIEELSQDDFDAYTKLVTSKKPQNLQEVEIFLESKIKDWPQKFDAVLKKFADDFIATTKQLKA